MAETEVVYKGYKIFNTNGKTFPELQHHICFVSNSIEALKERIDIYGEFKNLVACYNFFYICDKTGNSALYDHHYYYDESYRYFAVKIDCNFVQGEKLNDYTVAYRGIDYDKYKQIVSGTEHTTILISSLENACKALNSGGMSAGGACNELRKIYSPFTLVGANGTDEKFNVGYFDDDDIVYYDPKFENMVKARDAGGDFAYLVVYYPNGIKNAKHVGTKILTNGDNMDFTQLITMKMMSKLLDGDGDLDIGKMYLLQSLQKNGTIQIDDIMKSKLISKFGLDKDTEDLSVEKLMLLDMLQNGKLDISKLMTIKLLEKEF